MFAQLCLIRERERTGNEYNEQKKLIFFFQIFFRFG
jgi:hypothetical protein